MLLETWIVRAGRVACNKADPQGMLKRNIVNCRFAWPASSVIIEWENNEIVGCEAVSRLCVLGVTNLLFVLVSLKSIVSSNYKWNAA